MLVTAVTLGSEQKSKEERRSRGQADPDGDIPNLPMDEGAVCDHLLGRSFFVSDRKTKNIRALASACLGRSPDLKICLLWTRKRGRQPWGGEHHAPLRPFFKKNICLCFGSQKGRHLGGGDPSRHSPPPLFCKIHLDGPGAADAAHVGFYLGEVRQGGAVSRRWSEVHEEALGC